MYRTRVQPSKVARPTRDDVAKLANISGATVSRVLSGRTDVPISPEARQKVLEAVEKLGYQPNQMARALMTGRTGLVGLWTSLQYSRYRSQVLERMKMILRQTELAMAVTDIDEEYTWDHSFSRALRVPVEGIIAFDASASIEAFAQDYDRLAPNTPFVSMGAYWSESKSYVGVDLRSGADAAMDHLVSTGRRRIAYMAPWNSGLLEWGPRYEGYRTAMEQAGLPLNIKATKDTSLQSVREALVELLDGPEKPDAVLCMNDDIALSLAFALQQLGLRAGHDIAIVGFDGIQETEQCLCPITTVQQPIQEMGDYALKFLRAQMENTPSESGRPELQQIVLKPTLIIRDSTRA